MVHQGKFMRAFVMVVLLLSTVTLAQDDAFSGGERYFIGGEVGFSLMKIEESQFLLKAGCRITRHSGNSFFTLGYNFFNPASLILNNENNNNSNSRFGQFSLVYGYLFQNEIPIRFFNSFKIGVAGGISYNIIRYFKTYPDLEKNKLSTLNNFGIILSLSKYMNFSEDMYSQVQITTNFVNQYYRPIEYSAGLYFRLP